jgi:hypothetical protein
LDGKCGSDLLRACLDTCYRIQEKEFSISSQWDV